MQGLEIARAYYESHGKVMLERQFPELTARVAVGLAGLGSECLGFDDELSRDHDFEPGFCLWLTEADAREYGFRLERAYGALPREFLGLRRSALAPVGGTRHGVWSIGDFYRQFLGSEDVPESLLQWLYTPGAALGCACNGQVFRDELGEFSRIRQVLLEGYPEDVRRKKLAAHAVLMGQAGQYNFDRCRKRGEPDAAQLALYEFVRHGISAVYLLNRRYEPFYKWAFRGLRGLPILPQAEELLSRLLRWNGEPDGASEIQQGIRDFARLLSREFRSQELSDLPGGDLEAQAYVLREGIRDTELRNMHIMEGV